MQKLLQSDFQLQQLVAQQVRSKSRREVVATAAEKAEAREREGVWARVIEN